MYNIKNIIIVVALWIFISLAYASVYPLPTQGNDLIGAPEYTRVRLGDSFHTIGRRYDIGYIEMALANPRFNPKSPALFYKVLIPSEHILPPGPRNGIVINLPEMRLYYYPANSNEVMTFPIGIGILGWETPQGKLKVIEKIVNPTWYVPKSIQKYLATKGYNVADVIPPGPNDPLGAFALRLSNPSYLIHGTNDPTSIGTRASSGCIRLFPEDIQNLFQAVLLDTPVHIIDDPYKVGFADGKLYLSAFPELSEDQTSVADNYTPLVAAIQTVIKNHPVEVDWQKAMTIAMRQQGIPQIISVTGGS